MKDLIICVVHYTLAELDLSLEIIFGSFNGIIYGAVGRMKTTHFNNNLQLFCFIFLKVSICFLYGIFRVECTNVICIIHQRLTWVTLLRRCIVHFSPVHEGCSKIYNIKTNVCYRNIWTLQINHMHNPL